ncbi:hypothetical protein TNCV_925001 [Trichonephila clavipes]|nr:hypothetical protein TNCV_925001 [Trichonephila clavipes]
MSYHGVGRLHIVSGTVKAMDYIEILQNKLLPTARDLFENQSWIFQDDNAPCHRAKSSLPFEYGSVETIYCTTLADGFVNYMTLLPFERRRAIT